MKVLVNSWKICKWIWWWFKENYETKHDRKRHAKNFYERVELVMCGYIKELIIVWIISYTMKMMNLNIEKKF